MIFRASKDFVRIMHNMFKDQMFLFTGTEDVETLSLKPRSYCGTTILKAPSDWVSYSVSRAPSNICGALAISRAAGCTENGALS